MSDLPIALQIMRVRYEIGQISHTIHSLRQSGMDSASAQKLLVQKRADLDRLNEESARRVETANRDPESDS